MAKWQNGQSEPGKWRNVDWRLSSHEFGEVMIWSLFHYSKCHWNVNCRGFVLVGCLPKDDPCFSVIWTASRRHGVHIELDFRGQRSFRTLIQERVRCQLYCDALYDLSTLSAWPRANVRLSLRVNPLLSSWTHSLFQTDFVFRITYNENADGVVCIYANQEVIWLVGNFWKGHLWRWT